MSELTLPETDPTIVKEESLQPSVEPAATVWAPQQHLPELDGVRGLAILLVTVYRFAREVPTESLPGEVLSSVVSLGERGVDLFFVLSGFLITGVLLDSAKHTHQLRNFFVRRTLRIFPLYFAALALLLTALPAVWPRPIFVEAQQQQFYLWTYLANARITWLDEWCYGYLDPFWSLSVEEHFYLLWPLVIFCLSVRRSMWFAVFAGIACAVARVAYAEFGTLVIAPDVMSFFRFDGLLWGGAIATAARLPKGILGWRSAVAAIVVPLAITAIAADLIANRALTIPHSLWALFWVSGLVLLLTSSKVSVLARIFRDARLRRLGKYSYAMYVFQGPLIPLVAGVWSSAIVASWLRLDATTSVLATIVYTMGMFALTFASAVLSWHVLEKHFLKLKRYFPS